MVESLFLILFAFLGSFSQSVTGLGFAMIFMTGAGFFLPLKVASVVEMIIVLPLCFYVSIRYFKKINWRLIIVPLIVSLVFNFLGVKLLLYLDDQIVKKILGVILVVLALYNIFFSKNRTVKPTFFNKSIAGGTSGFFAGLCNIGGPPIAIYFLSATKSKEEYNATLQTFFIILSVNAILIHLSSGNVTMEVLKLSGISAIGMVFGTVLGSILFSKINENMIRKLVYIVMIAMGIAICFS